MYTMCGSPHGYVEVYCEEHSGHGLMVLLGYIILTRNANVQPAEEEKGEPERESEWILRVRALTKHGEEMDSSRRVSHINSSNNNKGYLMEV